MSNHRINKRITYSEKFYQISWKAQVQYLLGFAFLDDYGVWTANPNEIWKELFVFHKQIKLKNIFDILEELAEVGLIKLYAINGKLYQQYENFNTFQNFGQGYNKKKTYPEFEECDVDPEHNEGNTSNWVYSGVKGCLRVFLGVGSNTHSLSNSPSNSNSNSPTTNKFNYYREEDINKLDVEEKGVLKCFYTIGYKLREEYTDGWNKWIHELKTDFPDKDLLLNAKSWRDYFEDKNPKNHKSSFRNWVGKSYANVKGDLVVDKIIDSKLYKELIHWAGKNGQAESKCGSIFKGWIKKYGEEVVSKILKSCAMSNDSYHDFLMAMGELKEGNKK